MTVEASMMIGRKKPGSSPGSSPSTSSNHRRSIKSPLSNSSSNLSNFSSKPITSSTTAIRKRNSLIVSNNYLDLKLVMMAISKGDIPTSYPALFTIRTSCHLYYKLWKNFTYNSTIFHNFINNLLECEMPEGIDGKSNEKKLPDSSSGKNNKNKKVTRSRMEGLGLWAFGMMVNYSQPQYETFKLKSSSTISPTNDNNNANIDDYDMFESEKYGNLLPKLLENLMVLLLLSPHYSEASNTIKLLYKKFNFDLSLLFSIDLNKFQVPGKVSDHNFISLLHLIEWCIKHDNSSSILLKSTNMLLKLVSHILHHCDTSFFLVNSSTLFYYCFSYCYSFYFQYIATDSTRNHSNLWPKVHGSLLSIDSINKENIKKENLIKIYEEKLNFKLKNHNIISNFLINFDNQQEIKDYIQICGNLIVIFRYLAGVNAENRNFLASFDPLRWCLQASFHKDFDQDITRELLMLSKILYSDFNIRAIVEMKSSGVKVDHISTLRKKEKVFSPSNPFNTPSKSLNSSLLDQDVEYNDCDYNYLDGRVSTSTCSEDDTGIWLLSLSELFNLLTQNKYHLLDVLAEIYINIFEVSFLFSDDEMRYCLGCFSENKKQAKAQTLNNNSSTSNKSLNVINREMHPDHELFLIKLFDNAIAGVEKSIDEDKLNREFLNLDENMNSNSYNHLSSTADAAIRNTSSECLYRIIFKFERTFHVMSDRTTLLNSKTKILKLIMKVLKDGPNLWRISFLHLLECAVILFRSIDPIWLGFSLSDSDKCLVNTSLALQYWGEIMLEDNEKSRNFDQKDLECWNYLIGNDKLNNIHELFSNMNDDNIDLLEDDKIKEDSNILVNTDADNDDDYGNNIDISANYIDDDMPKSPFINRNEDDDDYNIGDFGVSISPDNSPPYPTNRKAITSNPNQKMLSSNYNTLQNTKKSNSHRVYMLKASNHHIYLKIAKEFLSRFASEFLPSISVISSDWDILTPSERCRSLLNFYYCIQILGYEVVKLNITGIDNMINYLWSIVSGGSEYGVLKISRIDLQCVHLLGILIEQKAIYYASNKLVNPSNGISRRESSRTNLHSTQNSSNDEENVLASDESEFFIENLSHIFPDASKFADCLVNILRLRPEDVAFAISTATDKSQQWEKLEEEVNSWKESNGESGEMPINLRQQQYLLQVHDKYVNSLSRWHTYDPHPDIHSAAISSIFRIAQLDANIRHKLLKFLPEILTLLNIFSPFDPLCYIPCLTLLKTMMEYVSKLELHAEEKIVELLIRCLSPQHPAPKLVSPYSISTNFYHFNLKKNKQSSRHANRLYLHAYACELIYNIGQESPGFIFRGISRLEIEDPIIAVLKLALEDVGVNNNKILTNSDDIIVSPSMPTPDETNEVSSRYTKVVLHSLKALTTIVHNFNIKPSWLPSPLLYHWSHYTASLSSRPILQPSLLPLVFSLLSTVRVHYRLAYFTYFLNLASCIMYACSDGSVCPNTEEDVKHLNNLKEISTQQVLPCLPLALDFIMLLQKKKQHVQLWRTPRQHESLMLNRSVSSQTLARVQSNAQFNSLRNIPSSGAFNSLKNNKSSNNFSTLKNSPSANNFSTTSHQSSGNLSMMLLQSALNSDDDIDLDELEDEFVPNEWVIEEVPTIDNINHSKVPIAINLLIELGILGASADTKKYRVISQNNLRNISSSNLNRLSSSKSLANFSNFGESDSTTSNYPSSLSTYTHTHALTMLTLQAITCVSVFVCNQDKTGYQRFKEYFKEKPLVSVVCSLIHSQSELDEEMMLAIENSSVVIPNSSLKSASSITNLNSISSNNLVAMGNEDSCLNMVIIKTQNLPISPFQVLQSHHSRTRLCKMNLRMQQQAVRKGVEMLKYFSQNEIELLSISLQAPHALLATIKISQETNNYHSNELQTSLCKIISSISNSQQLVISNMPKNSTRNSNSSTSSYTNIGFNLNSEHTGCENLMRCRVQDALVEMIETKHKDSARNAIIALHTLTLRLPYLQTLLEEPPLPLDNLLILKKQSVPKKPSSNKLDKIQSTPNLSAASNARIKLSDIHAFEKNPLVTYKGRLRLVDSIFRLAEHYNKDLKIIVFCLRFLMHFELYYPNEWRELFNVPPRYFYQQLIQNNPNAPPVPPTHHTSPTSVNKKTLAPTSTYSFTIDGFYNPYYSEWHEILKNMRKYLQSIVRVEEWQWQAANQGQDPLNLSSCCFAISSVPASSYNNSIAASSPDLVSHTNQTHNYSSYLYMHTVTGESLKENFITKMEVEDILASKFWQTQDKCTIM